MKKYFFPLAISGLCLASSCTDSPKADAAIAGEAVQTESSAAGEVYHADLQNSKIEWLGSKPVGDGHRGTLAITAGDVLVSGQQITGGSFTLDMKSIAPQDQDEEGNTKLKGHLLSPDFLEAEKFPEGTFEITSVKPVESTENLENKNATHMVTGNATLKGITKSLSFPARIVQTENQIVADATFNIDRTAWGINYQSDESIKDKFIRKEINLNVHLVAHK